MPCCASNSVDRLANGVKLRMLIRKWVIVSSVRPAGLGCCASVRLWCQRGSRPVRRRPIAPLVERPGVAQQRNGVINSAQPTANGGIGGQRGALIEQQEIAASSRLSSSLLPVSSPCSCTPECTSSSEKTPAAPDVHLVDQRPVAEIVVEGVDLHLAGMVAHHTVGAGADRMAGEIRQFAPFRAAGSWPARCPAARAASGRGCAAARRSRTASAR